MKREIKFRGLDTESKKWIVGHYSNIKGKTKFLTYFDVSDKRNHEYEELELDIHLISELILPDESGWDYSSCLAQRKVIPESIGQYIGLKDKNGKEIYEGDIFSDGRGELGVVRYLAPQFIVQTKKEIYALAHGKVNVPKLSYTEVIGNIHENKDLL